MQAAIGWLVRNRAVLLVLGTFIILSGAGLARSTESVNTLREQQQAQCQFDKDLGSVPLVVTPPAKKVSELGVKIVADSRFAYFGLHCPGSLPPDPSLVKWEKYYHLMR